MTIPKNSWPWLDTLIYRHCGGMFSLLLSLKTTAIGKNVCTSERENLVPPLNTEKAISQDVKRTIAGSSGLVVQTLRIGWIVEFEPWSAVHHQIPQEKPLTRNSWRLFLCLSQLASSAVQRGDEGVDFPVRHQAAFGET